MSVYFFVSKFEDTLALMSTTNENGNQIDFIRELCKHKTEKEIQEAEENFRRYLLLIKRICTRLESEEDAQKNYIDKPDLYCDSSVPQKMD